ncbi:reverse transcriptase domain-containing protein [Tanacetum coccineum]
MHIRGGEEGMFLGYKVNTKGIKVCPDKVEAVLSLPSPKCLKDIQKLNGKLASLNRFLSKSTEKSLLFFKTIKKCAKKSDFQWTTEAEAAFKQMKKLIAELPTPTAPMEKEEMIVYLAATREAVSAVLMTEREAKQMPVYFVSRALQGPGINYTPVEKLVIALVHASKRLKRYFQAHTMIVITGQPIKQYRPRTSIKGQILADFIVERPKDDSSDTITKGEKELLDPWTLFTDGSSCIDSSGAGLILTNPEGTEFTYALRFSMHAGTRSVVAKAIRTGYCWPTMHADARKMIRECQDFQGIDIAGPLPKGPGKVKFLIVAIDYFTKWIEAKPVATITGNQIKKFVWDNIVCRFDLPGEIISNKENQFRDNPFKDWCEKLCIRQRFASVKHPQANVLVERANKSLGDGIKVRLDEKSKDWIEEIPHVLWAHRTIISSSNGDTPFSLTYKTEAVIPAEISMPTLRTAEIDMVHNDEALEINLDLLEERREKAAIREARSKAKMENITTQKSATQALSQETLCTGTMMPAMQEIAESLAPSGKDRTK